MPQRSPLIIHYRTSQIIWLVLIVAVILYGVALAGFFYGNKTYSDNQIYIAELEAGIDELTEGLVQKQTALAALQLKWMQQRLNKPVSKCWICKDRSIGESRS